MLKLVTKFLVPVALINSSVFAGFFLGGSINAQRNSYKKEEKEYKSGQDYTCEQDAHGIYICPEYEYEYKSYKSSSISPGVSLLGGYAWKWGNFGFITELGSDFTISKTKEKPAMENIFTPYLTQKIGYYFNENNLVYLTGGVGALLIKSLDEEDNDEEGSKMVPAPSYILGLGYERKLTDNVKIFTEFNYRNAFIFGDGNDSINGQQIKLGARYYF